MNNNSEKKHENLFRFGVYQNGSVVVERTFSADDYNPVIRYSVDIKSRISDIISKLSRTMSRKNLTYIVFDYDNILEYTKRYNSSKESKSGDDSKLSQPEVVPFKRGNTGEMFKGAEFKFGLYINEHTIVERTFGVEGYNPSSRFSRELTDIVKFIVDDIKGYLKNADVNHMWDDNLIINTYNLNIGQIRDLSEENRALFLKNIKQIDFVKRIKKQYKTLALENENIDETIEY